jgi:hypothetical protein
VGRRGKGRLGLRTLPNEGQLGVADYLSRLPKAQGRQPRQDPDDYYDDCGDQGWRRDNCGQRRRG